MTHYLHLVIESRLVLRRSEPQVFQRKGGALAAVEGGVGAGGDGAGAAPAGATGDGIATAGGCGGEERHGANGQAGVQAKRLEAGATERSHRLEEIGRRGDDDLVGPADHRWQDAKQTAGLGRGKPQLNV